MQTIVKDKISYEKWLRCQIKRRCEEWWKMENKLMGGGQTNPMINFVKTDNMNMV